MKYDGAIGWFFGAPPCILNAQSGRGALGLSRAGRWEVGGGVEYTHRLLSSSFLGLPYRILNMNHKKELLRSLWV